ncbi:hypothetical protein FKM82_025318, partial [Ascaphus truei]
EAYSVARQFNLIPPVCEQAEYHLFQREKVETQLPELYHKIGVGSMTWSPLACGLITGKYAETVPENSRASFKGYHWLKEKAVSAEGKKQHSKVKDLHPIAERLNCTVAQLAIAWCLRSEGVSSVLLGVSNCEQLLENLGSIQVRGIPSFRLCRPAGGGERGPISPSSLFSPLSSLLSLLSSLFSPLSSLLCSLSSLFSPLSPLSPLSLSPQVLAQLTPQIVTEIDQILCNKPNIKKDSRA